MANIYERGARIGIDHPNQSPSQEAFQRRLKEYKNLHKLVWEHVTNPENIAEITEGGRMCGDGRYEGNDGKFARFGADAGYVLGLLSLNNRFQLGLSPTQIVDAVIENSEGKFSFHSDSHTEEGPEISNTGISEDADKIGCGHMGQTMLAENAFKYLLDPEDVKEAAAYMRFRAAVNPDKVDVVILHGPHKEKGVIINVGKMKKIAHGNGYHQWFVVNPGHDEEYADRLFGKLEEALPVLREKDITKKHFTEILDRQTRVTAGILAKDLPVYKVDVDHEIPTIEHGEPFLPFAA